MIKKLLIVSPSRFPGTTGDTVNYLEIVNQLSSEGIDVFLICPRTEEENISDFQGTVKVFRVPLIPPRLSQLKNGIRIKHIFNIFIFNLLQYFLVLKTVRKFRLKSVYLRHSLLTFSLPPFLKLLGTKIIADGELLTDSISFSTFPGAISLVNFFEKRALNSYSYFRVSTVSQAESLISRGFPRNKVLIIPIGIKIDNIPRTPITQIPEHTFGFFGTLEPWQGPHLLLEAFTLVLKKVPTAMLYIIGDGSLARELKEHSYKLKMNNNIAFIGAVPRNKLWKDYFNKFRIVLIPRPLQHNQFDHLPSIKLVEALAAGKGVIVSNLPGLSDIPENVCIRVPPGDALSLALAMENLDTDPLKLFKMVETGFSYVKNHDIKISIEKLIDAIDQMGVFANKN